MSTSYTVLKEFSLVSLKWWIIRLYSGKRASAGSQEFVLCFVFYELVCDIEVINVDYILVCGDFKCV